MNWDLDSLTPEEQLAIERAGHVGAFLRVLMPRMLAEEPPRQSVPAAAATPVSAEDAAPVNTYVPLAHRDSGS
jgi:hypothetical protein